MKLEEQEVQNVGGFTTPNEEIDFLREQVRERERELERFKTESGETRGLDDMERRSLARNVVKEYKEIAPADVLHEDQQMDKDEAEKISLALAPEKHDTIMQELLFVLEERGIMNALSVVGEMNSPHIEDDFHRLLVQYIKSPDTQSFPKEEKAFPALNMTLFEVALPQDSVEDNQGKQLKEIISSMEQFYAGMLAVDSGTQGFFSSAKGYFTLEIALPSVGEEISFYVAVPNDHIGLFEKHTLSLFPHAKISEATNDYNIFNEDGFSVGSYAVPTGNPIFPIKTYDQFDADPMNVLLNIFSKLEREGEGLAVQFVLAPASGRFVAKYKEALQKIKDGEKVKDAINIPQSALGEAFNMVKSTVAPKTPKKDEEVRKHDVDEDAVERINKKLGSQLLDTNIRLVASAGNRMRAEKILSEAESTFRQFEDPQGGGVRFRKPAHGSNAESELFHQFSFRLLSGKQSIPLNTAELTTLAHFPQGNIHAPILKQAKAGVAPAPTDISRDGVILGENLYHGTKRLARFAPEDRMRHFYAIGQTGTGKTTLLKNMIVQDIHNGEGVCMIDPHGTDIEDILANIPRERADDVIYFDPSYTDRPMGLNMLEYDTRFPEQKTFVVNEMLSIFNKLFDMKTAGGPMFEQYFRNAVLLVLEDPESGSTLLDVSRVLADEKFRSLKLSRCKNPMVLQFWREIAGKAGGEASLANIVPYITSKFDVFLSNDIMRPIIAQEKSAFNFRKVMDERKILLVNLSKGRLGDINANLLGLILVGKILMSALSRVDALGGEKPADFHLYIDEFQNITTDSIATILSEARKYRLGLNVAHQFIAQLEDNIRDAVFGNVGSVATFRVGAEDAEFLEKFYEPTFDASDIMRLDNRNAYVKMLIDGTPSRPFNIVTLKPDDGERAIVPKIKELSHLKYGRPRAEIENEILAKYQAGSTVKPNPPSEQNNVQT